MSLPKYAVAAAGIRAQIAAGLLLPGAPAPSGAALSRATGYSALTCRKALRTLISEGVLVPGVSPNARAHVAPRTPAAGEAADPTLSAGAARALSAALAARRRAAGLTQPQLAGIVGVSVTTVGHAETGRLWQSRRFWEHADKELCAHGQLLALHQAYRAAGVPADVADAQEETGAGAAVGTPPEIKVTLSGPVASVTVTWIGGEAVTVYPP